MANSTHSGSRGRPPISPTLWNHVLDLHADNKAPSEIMEITGLGQTKVYEIIRVGTRQSLPTPSDQVDAEQAQEGAS